MSEVLGLSPIAGSIGATWPPISASNNRLRGIYNEKAIDSASDVRDFAEVFQGYQEMLEEPGFDRLSIRLVASIGATALLGEQGVPVEGALPFRRDGEQLALVYAGWNSPDRSVPESTYYNHRQLLGSVVQYPPREESPERLLERKGYEPRLISRETLSEERAALVSSFTELYAAFGYNQEETEELLLSPSSTIGYIEQDGRVVSTAMAEAGVVNVDGVGDVHMVEMTEAFTRPEYRGQGLYEAISGYVLRLVMSERQEGRRELDVLYGESNLAMPGVLHAARANGRRFNHFDAVRFGVCNRNFGILPQNVTVRDGAETRPYNDFALTYIPLDEED